MTIDDFANRVFYLRTTGGDVSLAMPCCANCKHYIKDKTYDVYYCNHPEGVIDDLDNPSNVLIAMDPQDFCSRFEERNK